MTTKDLTGTYASGYAIASGVSSIVVESTALVEGAGLSAAAFVSITNLGTIDAAAGQTAGEAGSIGVELAAGGGVSNRKLIEGGTGAVGLASGSTGGTGGLGGSAIVLAAASTVSNAATIRGGAGGMGGQGANGGVGGAGGAAVVLAAGGSISNLGTLAGGAGGAGGSGSTQSANGVSGAGGAGVVLSAGGIVTNGSTASAKGLIEGGTGVYADHAGATVINYGTIVGSVDSVDFTTAGDELIAQSGAEFTGAIAGGGGTLDLASGAGTISGLGASGVLNGAVTGSFSGFGSYIVGSGADWALAGVATLAAGQSLTDDSSLVATGAFDLAKGATLALGSGGVTTFEQGGDGAFSGAIVGPGTIVFLGGADSFSGATLSAAHMAIQGATATLTGTITATRAVDVIGSGLLIGAGGATLAGGGQWVLSNSPKNSVLGLAASDTLTNLAATISGAGQIGDGFMGLVNDIGATIDADDSVGLTLNTGSSTIANAGLIEATGSGGMMIASAVVNTGELLAAGGDLTVDAGVTNTGTLQASGGLLTLDGAVAGQGAADIDDGGEIIFDAAFSGPVDFTDGTGELVLAQSQPYAGTVTNFSTVGASSLDLRDIGFVDSGEVTFSGSATGGVLTVSDGVHTAEIDLAGDFANVDFTAQSDGQGGVLITGRSTQIYWLKAVSGDFADASKWGGGEVPTASDNAILDPSGSNFTVTSTYNETVRSLQLGANATLVLSHPQDDYDPITFTAIYGTGTSANLGTISLAGSATLAVGGAVDNAGTIEGGSLLADPGGVTLTGGGLIGSFIEGYGVINVNNTVLGGIEVKSFVNDRGGIVENEIIVGSNDTFDNYGLIESIGGFFIGISGIVNNVYGTIVAASGISLSKGTIVGGAIHIESGGVIETFGAGVDIEGSAIQIDAGGELNVVDRSGLFAEADITSAGSFIAGASTTVQGAVTNTGTITADNATLTIDGAVTGAGIVTIEKGTAVFEAAFSENVTFEGAGTLVLAQSQDYSGQISKFSTTGTTSIDLEDIAFAGATVSYSGTTTSGVLTVKSGSEVANITLEGNFTKSTFTLSQDASGGTIVTDPKAPTAPALASAMAGFTPMAATALESRNLPSDATSQPIFAVAAGGAPGAS